METRNEKREAGSDGPRPVIRSYEDLEVYQRSMDLLVPLHAVVLTFPDNERFELASQLRRASKSIPANIAEGYGKKRSAKEFKAYLNNALGSANEVIVHLKISIQLAYVDSQAARDLVDRYTIVAKELHRLMETRQTFNNGTSPTDPASRIPRPASSPKKEST